MKTYVKKALHNREFMLLLFLAIILVLIPVFAPQLAPHDPIANDYANAMNPGSREYPFGTDQIGRCILSRLVWGGRTSLLIVFVVVFIVSVIGIILGITAGFFGGWVDMLITRFTDIVMALPATVFVIALVSVLGPSQIIIRNILPNIFPYLLVNITQDIGNQLLTLSGLSLLGLSSQPPTPEWGFMLSEGKKYIQAAPWLIFYPGLIIVIHVIVFNLLGDSLRDILDPRYTKQRGKERRMKLWLKRES